MPRHRAPHPAASGDNSPAAVDPQRDHLFISYAWEDGALAEWLVRKLTAAGYLVWCDRFKVLAGDRWPKDIDRAIKTRTFRMIALMSRSSLSKANPTKERQLALALAKERQEDDFIIPLNLEGLRPTEMDWGLSDINFVDFTKWDVGLRALLEKLERVNARRPRGASGAAVAIASYLPPRVLRDSPEELSSNCFPVLGIPDKVVRFTPSRPVFPAERAELLLRWAFQRSGNDLLAFTDPPSGIIKCSFARGDDAPWRGQSLVHSIGSTDTISALIRKSMMVACIARGLERVDTEWAAYFPRGLLQKDKLTFQSYNKRKSSVMVLGERRTGRSRTRYNLGIAFRVRHDVIAESPVVQTKIRLAVSDPSGVRLDWKLANARRKQIARGWWNHEFLVRQLAISQFLAGSTAEIVVGTVEGEQVRISATPLAATVAPSVHDLAVKALGARVEDHVLLGGLIDEDDDTPAGTDPDEGDE